MRFTPSTLTRADLAPNRLAKCSERSSEMLALRSFRNDVDCTNGRASPVLLQASYPACPLGVEKSGASPLQSYSDSVWFWATPPYCHSNMKDIVRRRYVNWFVAAHRNFGFAWPSEMVLPRS